MAFKENLTVLNLAKKVIFVDLCEDTVSEASRKLSLLSSTQFVLVRHNTVCKDVGRLRQILRCVLEKLQEQMKARDRVDLS